MTAEEWRTRCDLAAAYRLIADYGWDDLVFTHLSARVPGRDEHFLLNPYGFAFDEITAESLVKVDLDGVPVERTEYGVNPAGFTIHSAVHGATSVKPREPFWPAAICARPLQGTNAKRVPL